MGARQRLNAASINGAAIVATVLGMICESWTVFFLVLALLVWGAFCSRDIRLTSDRRHP